jgi:AraC-like DNA-binding protein
MLTTVLLLTPVYVTLFWAIVLHLYQRENNPPRRFLGKLMAVALALYLSHFFYFQKLHGVYIWLDCFYNLASLSVYPMYYVYALLLTRDKKFSFRLHSVYFIAPVLIFLAMAAGYLIMDDEQELLYIREVIYGFGQRDGIHEWMYGIYVAEKTVFTIQMFIYVALTTRLIIRHQELLDELYSFSDNLSLRWVQVFNITLFITSAASTVSIIMGRESFVDNPARLAFPAILFSTVLFIIAALGNRQMPIKITECDELYKDEFIDDKIPAKLRDYLISLFEKELLYLNKDLTIFDVTERLGTNRTYVSRIINNEFGLNFATFVNNYRVDHAKRLMQDGKYTHLEEISELSGFGSINSLYRAFLLKEKISITQFRKTIRGKKTTGQRGDGAQRQ